MEVFLGNIKAGARPPSRCQGVTHLLPCGNIFIPQPSQHPMGLGAAQHRTTSPGPEADPQSAEPSWQSEAKQQLRYDFSPSKSCKIHEK